MVFLMKYKENRNLCYHGTGSEESAREGIREQYEERSHYVESCATRKTMKTIWKQHQPNAMQLKKNAEQGTVPPGGTPDWEI